jgi:hypothetical protein
MSVTMQVRSSFIKSARNAHVDMQDIYEEGACM